MDVTTIPTLLERIHERVLKEARSRCALYDQHLDTFQRKMEEELDDHKRKGVESKNFILYRNTDRCFKKFCKTIIHQHTMGYLHIN